MFCWSIQIYCLPYLIIPFSTVHCQPTLHLTPPAAILNCTWDYEVYKEQRIDQYMVIKMTWYDMMWYYTILYYTRLCFGQACSQRNKCVYFCYSVDTQQVITMGAMLRSVFQIQMRSTISSSMFPRHGNGGRVIEHVAYVTSVVLRPTE